MSTFAKLNIALTSTTASFTAGIKRATSRLAIFGTVARSVNSIFGSLFGRLNRFLGITGLISSAIAAIGFGKMIKDTFETVDSMAKLSDRLGFNIELLIGFVHAADLSGVDIESLGKSLVKFTENLGKAKAGIPSSIAAFEQLGLSADELLK